MSAYLHAIALRVGNNLIAGAEVELVRRGFGLGELHGVFRNDQIELASQCLYVAGIGKIGRIDCGADQRAGWAGDIAQTRTGTLRDLEIGSKQRDAGTRRRHGRGQGQNGESVVRHNVKAQKHLPRGKKARVLETPQLGTIDEHDNLIAHARDFDANRIHGARRPRKRLRGDAR